MGMVDTMPSLQVVVSQEGVEIVIDSLASEEEVAPQDTLFSEANLLEHSTRGLIPDGAPGLDALEGRSKKELRQ